MTTLQIIALILIGAGVAVAIGFFIAFLLEVNKQEKSNESVQEPEVEPEVVEDAEVVEIDIDEMLAKLEENAEKKEDAQEEVEVENDPAEPEVVAAEEQVEEGATETEVDIDEMLAKLEENAENTEEVQAENETATEEVVEEAQENVAAEEASEPVEEKEPEEPKTTIVIKKIVKEGPEFDYRVRLDKIKESEEKLEKDLDKTLKAITKYERTERRLARNQKLLDRKAGELANLNLLMYNVTDIKNVDEEKKTRQEELVAHISELKASIEDAEKYLSANAEKHANNIKLRDYLLSEQKRYKEEWAELEILIAQAEGRDPITTVETKVEEVPADEVPASDDETPADDGDQE
ncbi:MAG: hypothetical protein IJW24_00900 [Clostridia bacterium]|nr:hypothetical protein [Clostridia bacterium]